MKRVIPISFLAVILFLSYLLFYPDIVEEKKLELPQKALVNIEGEEVNLRNFIGERDLLLLFLHPAIKSSREQLNYLEAVQPPVEMFFVVMGNFPPADLKEIQEDLISKNTLLLDRDASLAKKLDVYSIPTILLFDRVGKLKKRYSSLLTEGDLREEFPGSEVTYAPNFYR